MGSLQRTFQIIATMALATSCTLYTPLQLAPSTAPVVEGDQYGTSVVEGRSCQWFVVPFILFGDNSLAAAKESVLVRTQAQGLIDVTVDTELTNYVVALERCTVVRGRPVYAAGKPVPAEPEPPAPAAAPAPAVSEPAPDAPPAASAPPRATTVDIPRNAPSEATVRAAVATSGNMKMLALCNQNFGDKQASMALDLKIAPSGRLVSVAAPGRSPRFSSCVEQSLRGLAFNAFDGDPVSIHIELSIAPVSPR